MFFNVDRSFPFEMEPSEVFKGGEKDGVTFGHLGVPENAPFAPMTPPVVAPKGKISVSSPPSLYS